MPERRGGGFSTSEAGSGPFVRLITRSTPSIVASASVT
jgi:hypothetical protein